MVPTTITVIEEQASEQASKRASKQAVVFIKEYYQLRKENILCLSEDLDICPSTGFYHMHNVVQETIIYQSSENCT